MDTYFKGLKSSKGSVFKNEGKMSFKRKSFDAFKWFTYRWEEKMLLYLVRILNKSARLVETERQRLTKKSENFIL